MKSRNCLQSALIMIGLGLFCILVGPLHVMSLDLKYEKASGSKSDNIVTIKEVKDVSPNTYGDRKLDEMPKDDSRNAIADAFSPIQNCKQARTCDACFDKKIAQKFKCKWCSKLKRCSDKGDWHSPIWVQVGCHRAAYDSPEQCNTTTKGGGDKKIRGGKSRGISKGETGAIIGVVVAVIVICIAGVLFYGYKNPTSKLGMLVIQYRPSKLFRRSR